MIRIINEYYDTSDPVYATKVYQMIDDDTIIQVRDLGDGSFDIADENGTIVDTLPKEDLDYVLKDFMELDSDSIPSYVTLI